MKISRHFFSLIFMLAAISFIGCSDDDDNGGINSTPLEGTVWTEVSYTSTGCNDPADNETGTSTCTATECYKIRLASGIITFTNTEDGITETSEAPYTISGNTITVSIGGTLLPVTYAISGNTLTINLVNDPFDGCNSVSVYTAAG